MEVTKQIPYRYKNLILWDVGRPISWHEYGTACNINVVDFAFSSQGEISHTVNHNIISVCIDGNTVIKPKSKSHSALNMRKNSFVLSFPGHDASFEWKGNGRHLNFIFENDANLQLKFFQDVARNSQLLKDDFVVKILYKIHQEICAEKKFSTLFAQSAIETVINYLKLKYNNCDLPDHSPAPSHYISSAINFINQSFSEPITLTEIIADTPSSPGKFIREFRSTTGLTPYQYVTHVRIEAAKRLLAQTHLSLAQVAVECGFYDQSRLSAVFRKLTGVTPGAYRHSL